MSLVRSFAGARATVFGAARSGVAAARLLYEQGARVTLCDERLTEPPSGLLAADVAFEHGFTQALDADLFVVSPGVPTHSAPFVRARARGVSLMGEMALGVRFVRRDYLAVTGTNGKSTVASLLGAMLPGSTVCGNLGTPLTSVVHRDAPLVVEASSFQLATVSRFAPKVSCILNVDEDHLDWHASFDDYVRAKGRVFAEQTEGALVIGDEPFLRRLARGASVRVLRFGEGDRCDAGLRGDTLYLGDEPLLRVGELGLVGRHNVLNALAAALCAREFGALRDDVVRALKTFRGLPHRLQTVGTTGGVRFVDDSKGTNPHAVRWALASVPGPVVVIMGGLDKGVSFESLKGAVSERARAVVALGVAAPRVVEAFGSLVPVTPVADMDEAVRVAFDAAREGDTVLLSPACASFDMFADYAERGDRFREAFLALAASRPEATCRTSRERGRGRGRRASAERRSNDG